MAWYSLIFISVAIVSTIFCLLLFLFLIPFVKKMDEKKLIKMLIKFRLVSSMSHEDVTKAAARFKFVIKKGRPLMRGIDLLAFLFLFLVIIYRDEKILVAFGITVAFSVVIQVYFFLLRVLFGRLNDFSEV